MRPLPSLIGPRLSWYQDNAGMRDAGDYRSNLDVRHHRLPGEHMSGQTEKQPFDIDQAMDRIRDAVKPFPKAAMFELAERGYSSPFEQLIACLISVRTYDEVSL